MTAGPADGVVDVRALEKVYADGARALEGVDLAVGPGEIFGLLGPNGAGKTTTVMLLIGAIQRGAQELAEVMRLRRTHERGRCTQNREGHPARVAHWPSGMRPG